jgi:hypothetical protein
MAFDYQPMKIVEDKGFISLLNCLDPKYKIPHRTTFSKSIIPKMY